MDSLSRLIQRLKNGMDRELQNLKEKENRLTRASYGIASRSVETVGELERLKLIWDAVKNVPSCEEPDAYDNKTNSALPIDCRADILLYLIGHFGIISWQDMEKRFGKERSDSLRNFIGCLFHNHIAECFSVPWGKRAFAMVFPLTEKGKHVYRKLFSEEPVISEPEKLDKKYGDMLYGCHIRFASFAVQKGAEEMGLQHTFIERKSDKDGQWHAWDFIGNNESPDAVVSYDFFESASEVIHECDDLLKITSHIVFVQLTKQEAKQWRKIIRKKYGRELKSGVIKIKITSDEKTAEEI